MGVFDFLKKPVSFDSKATDDWKPPVSEKPAPVVETAGTRFLILQVHFIAGVGTVVVGNLATGVIRIGQTGIVRGKTVRIKAIERKKEKITSVRDSLPVALNLMGVTKDEVATGDQIQFD